MDTATFQQLHGTVLWAAFVVAIVFGFIAQRCHFCTMGAISDIASMGSWTRMRMWVLAVAVAMIGFQGMAWLGWIDPSKTIYSGAQVLWASALVGGFLFGFGMVLASGCGSKTLVRIGGGSLKALTVFFVMGFSAFATLSGVLAVLRVNTVDRLSFQVPGGAALPAWLGTMAGVDQGTMGLLLALLLGGGLLVWVLSNRDFRSPGNVLGGAGLGLCVVIMWWVSGRLGFVAEHPETLESVYVATDSGRMEAFSFTAPMAYTLDWLVLFSDANNLLTLGVASVAGVVLGSLLQSLLGGSFRWEGFRSTQDTALHLGGAVMMGVGGVTALGCTVGQGLSGLSTLSMGSVLAVAAIVVGALGGLRFQMWLLERG